MPPKAKIPAPIDRPLSRAYLREFKGWSTAYPPGVSDPTSLRVMENVLINRDGSARVRPGLRYVSRTAVDSTIPWVDAPPMNPDWRMVGSHENFYLADGRKAYLFAVRRMDRVDERVEFKVACAAINAPSDELHIFELSDLAIAFDMTEWADGGDVGDDVPHFTSGTTYVRYLQVDNKILALSNGGEPFIMFSVGATKKAYKLQSIDYPLFDGDPGVDPWYSGPGISAPMVDMVDRDWINSDQTTRPAEFLNRTATSLKSLDDSANVYNLMVFYTYSNPIGESKPSQPTIVRTMRMFGQWSAMTPMVPGTVGDASSPGTVATNNPTKMSDQLYVEIFNDGYTGLMDAIAKGATHWNIYVAAWSDQAPVPVEATRVISKPIGDATTSPLWAMLHPGLHGLGISHPVPTIENRYNSTAPAKAAQGLVASDRVVLVNDPTAQAVIRWTTNEQGSYTVFTPSRGGGYKTLTSGNMQVPASVKLWQNPQSADTITVLCRGTDSHSSSYYMAPAQIASQSDATNIMGFEETTATPGTTSPYGCEVANNALYHPLDDQLMKSTASNYNINHKSMTDQISEDWVHLVDKHKIVSCFHDNRLYYLVHNPAGEALLPHCNGNEIWVLDLAAEGGTWSRWLVQGVSLRKIELDGRVQLSLVKENGLYVFDDLLGSDDFIDPVTGELQTGWGIPWKLETNTQGANRAHDAWAHLQLIGVTLGNFRGTMRYGIRGWDRHGKKVELFKTYRQLDTQDPGPGVLPYDNEDALRIARELKEWFFFAESMEDAAGFTLRTAGQINLVQYRYTPISVNNGYEWGSTETFEYARASANWNSRTTDNGIPQPMLEQRGV